MKLTILNFTTGHIHIHNVENKGDRLQLFRWLANDFPIKISFEICSKQLSTMKNRFLTHPKPEHLIFNELLKFETKKKTIFEQSQQFVRC